MRWKLVLHVPNNLKTKHTDKHIETLQVMPSPTRVKRFQNIKF